MGPQHAPPASSGETTSADVTVLIVGDVHSHVVKSSHVIGRTVGLGLMDVERVKVAGTDTLAGADRRAAAVADSALERVGDREAAVCERAADGESIIDKDEDTVFVSDAAVFVVVVDGEESGESIALAETDADVDAHGETLSDWPALADDHALP